MLNRQIQIIASLLATILAGCSTPDSARQRAPGDCSAKGTETGAAAVGEFDAMAATVKLGARCTLTSNGGSGAYNLQLKDGKLLALAVPAGATTTGVGASREVCSGVPYWRILSTTALVDSRPAILNWAVREDKSETVEFQITSADQVPLVGLDDCR